MATLCVAACHDAHPANAAGSGGVPAAGAPAAGTPAAGTPAAGTPAAGAPAAGTPAAGASGSDAAGVGGAAGDGAGGAAGDGAGGAAGDGNTCPATAPTKHRAQAAVCDHDRAVGPEPDPTAVTGCKTDAECTDGDNGQCTPLGRGVNLCTYDECFSDADCPDGPCVCGEGDSANNRCFATSCRTDADCDGSYCSPTFGSCGAYSGVVGYQCHSCEDECTNDTDCSGGAHCAYEPTVGHWVCSTAGCVG